MSVLFLLLAAGLLAGAAPLADGAESAEVVGLNVPRAGHTGTQLLGGGILIAGGENAVGVVRETETFDPSSRRFSFAGRLETGRADHTATLLSDGRVFLIGGRDSDRALASTEIGDADGRAFRTGPALNNPRFGHTATTLPDGRIVIVGGDPAGSIEIFEPGTGAFRFIDARLSVSRRFHSAALLRNGTILIAGGVDMADGSVLASAEILDIATMTISLATSPMRVPRTRFTLNVLPDGKVQAIGGDARVSMEMFNPIGMYFTARAGLLGVPGALSDALKTPSRSAVLGRGTGQELSSKGVHTLSTRGAGIILTPDALDRIGASVTRNPSAGFALATGGMRSSGVLSDTSLLTGDSAATLTTDKTDYLPGETVVITGAGWQPAETVSMTLHQDDGDLDLTLTSTADDTGTFTNSDFVVQDSDLGVSFMLTATGELSGYSAQTTFTDGGSMSYSPTSRSLSAAAGGAAVSFAQTVTAPAPPPASNNNGSFTATLQVAGTGVNPIPAIWVSTSKTPLSFPTAGSSDSWTVSFTVPAGTTAGTYTADIKANPSIPGVGGGSGTHVTLTVTGCSSPTITTCPPAQEANANASCQATVPDFTASAVVSSPGCTATVTQSPAAGTTVSGAGAHTITITATNASGTATCDATFNVVDVTKPVITVDGANPVTVECHTSYTDAGATANDACAGSVPVTPSGSVDPNTIGTYTITYTAIDPSGNTQTATRTVHVGDSTPPVITLNGTSSMTVECHTSFTDPGATANDSCAGSVPVTPSGSVDANTLGTYTLTYDAVDPSGNHAVEVTRTVHVIDTTKPVITVNGSNPTTVECHTSYTDAGATAHDTCAGDFAATASGSVNVNAPGTYTITYNASDPSGNPATAVTRTVNVVDTTPPTIAIIGDNPATVICHTSYADAGAMASDACAGAVGVVASGNVDVNTVGTYTITYTASDPSGNKQTAMRIVNVTNVAPVVNSVTGPSDPLPAPSTVTVTATFTDPDPGQTHTCTFTWDDPSNPTSSVTVAAGETSCSASHTYASASVNTVSVDVTDGCADDSGVFQFVVIYDPNAGFVTGGGFINSPPGAYTADASLVGKANFGFVSKYLKGAKVPTGSTEFQFQVANFNFHSEVYQWLVISGPLAQYKGTGTVNGSGNYGFLLTATDGQVGGGGGVDKFRIKIWDNNAGGAIVYDNSPGSSDDINSANPEAIAGGSVVIHKN